MYWLAGVCVALAGAASAADTAADTAADMGSEMVTVYGQGETRQIQTVTKNEMALQEPGASPFQTVATLPGVNFQSADPFGAYEWSTRISVRGFNQNQLGFTLDGVPLGDMSYGNYNGLHISRAIATENIAKSELAQGTGALGTASTSNLGGTLAFYSLDPAKTWGITASTSYGSDDAVHEYIRLESGELASGTRGYVSYSFEQADKWKGVGLHKQQQVNGKLVQDIGDAATITGFLNYSVRRENDYQDFSLDMLNRLGPDWDNISGDWAKAVAVAKAYQAGTALPAPFATVDDAYYNAAGLRNDVLGGVSADWTITSGLSLKVTGYGHNNTGRGLWWTPYVPTSAFIPGGAPISVRTTEYAISRYGVTSSLTWDVADHEIEAGVWYENNNFHQARRYYALAADGSGVTSLQFPKNPMATQWAFAFNTTTLVFHLQDTWKITEALKLNFGFKTQDVNNGAHFLADQVTEPFKSSLSATQFTGGKIKTDVGFLPQAGVNYRIDDQNEVFADYSKNQRAFVSAATSGPFSTTQPGFEAIKGSLKPETSQTIEAGYRYNSDIVQAVIAGYYVMFKNRQLATQAGTGIVGNPLTLSNVGSVTSKGIETAATWHFWDKAWLSGSYAFNDSTYDDDTLDGTGAIIMHTKDKTTTDAPKHILNAALNYDDGALFGNLDLSYMSKRYFTYENDQSVGGRTLVSLTAGYRLHADNLLDGLELQVNVENLFDERYVSTIGSNGFGASGDNQTLLPGAPRSVFVSLKKSFP
jgi:Outer membrane receptor proteins, mostly Fe transport